MEVWRYSSDANVISTPVVANDLVIFGNQNGDIAGISIKDFLCSLGRAGFIDGGDDV